MGWVGLVVVVVVCVCVCVWGGGVHNWENYFIDLFHVSGNLENFGGVLF